MSERDDERGFTVVDRRASAGAQEAEAQPSPTPGAPAPAFDFAMLVQSIALTALHQLGKVPDPATGEPGETNLPLARQNIEILEILDVKTRGNLDAEESHLLASLLYEVRMHFVEASKKGR
ncbi:MAG: DUF1844 domain-containing protein [Proteobacteria bacterium]|nr:MAG: DUF1844 domain-containing protein [Pseudomonadota bacterium]